jgi:hypothetical protein
MFGEMVSASLLDKECAAMWQARHPRTPSPSAVTDQPWAIWAPLMPPARTQRGGRPREVDRRAVGLDRPSVKTTERGGAERGV